MEIQKLIKMANQIGDFFEANPDAEEAKKEIASHLKRFWNSVMIQSIVNHVKQAQVKQDKSGDLLGLHPKVAQAILEHIA